MLMSDPIIDFILVFSLLSLGLLVILIAAINSKVVYILKEIQETNKYLEYMSKLQYSSADKKEQSTI
jgi:hypothetical protein